MASQTNVAREKALSKHLYPQHSVTYFRIDLHTKFGEFVAVSGNVEGLGCWEPSRAHILRTGKDCFPCWYSDPGVKLTLKSMVRYKYVILDGNGRLIRWVDADKDRVLVPTGEEMVVEDDNGIHRSTVSLPPPRPELVSGASLNADSVNGPSELDGKETERVNLAEQLNKLSDPCEVMIDERDTVYVVSMELPVKVVAITEPSQDETSAVIQETEYRVVKQKYLFLPTLHSLRSKVTLSVKFVGWPGIMVNSEAEQQKIAELLEPHGCIPVFPPADQFDMYLKFLQKFLWPTFHNVLILNIAEQAPFNAAEWRCYQSMNKIWADTVVRNAHETDLIFINDLPLLLVSQYIIRKMRRANVGFFLHTPFPSSEIFRCLPVREEILRGMLCADLIGFQFFEYARHFLVASKRLLGLEHTFRLGGFLSLDYCGRSVALMINHVHIQYDDLKALVDSSSEIENQFRHIREALPGKFIFASVDRCEQLSGLLLKFRAFQLFLRTYPYAKDRCVLIQYGYPVLSAESEQMGRELRQLAAEVNAEFNSHYTNPPVDDENHPFDKAPSMLQLKNTFDEGPIVVILKSITVEEKYALFRAADCLLDTSIRDGLNLNPFEYICCRHDSDASVILSEFTGSSAALALAQRVNPWKSDEVAQKMDRTVNRTAADESHARQLRDQQYLQVHSTLGWAEWFLRETRRARKRDDLLYVSWGFANTFRVLGLASHFSRLDIMNVSQQYRRSQNRVLFFDHEGTLAADRRRITAVPGFGGNLLSQGSAPSAQVKSCLRSLLKDSRNVVVILSGRDKCLLTEWFGDIDGIGLCAEHGFYFKVPKFTGNEWQCPAKVPDLTWKIGANELMKQYVHRTPGAFVENKGSALVFQYRDADPDFGAWQAKELGSYLHELMFGYPVITMEGKGYVEVKLRGVNKGRAVEKVLAKMKDNSLHPDFILCVGDDRTDEDMFEVIETMYNDASDETKTCPSRRNSSDDPNKPAKRPSVYTVTVGKKPSKAKFYVNDVDEVSEVLQSLAQNVETDQILDCVGNKDLRSGPLAADGDSPITPNSIGLSVSEYVKSIR